MLILAISGVNRLCLEDGVPGKLLKWFSHLYNKCSTLVQARALGCI